MLFSVNKILSLAATKDAQQECAGEFQGQRLVHKARKPTQEISLCNKILSTLDKIIDRLPFFINIIFDLYYFLSSVTN